ncbi:hypothetical protein SAMN02745912_02756 [Paramaledivibacter caminithermalis DSM 15212]|jgi:hypothetical protein|uniref:Uncharacterized protein n=2 Tax=Paramaledivibacter TaxID=1884934 RepID=A0A1M6QW02_PARC5|nr:hypothetical protein SAMN02745912_02756 [Paramaledivibacter caminithermalis DSM 15212]
MQTILVGDNMSYELIIKENSNIKNFIIEESEAELALYEAIDTLQLWMGADWMRNAKDRLNKSFNTFEKELETKGKTELGYNIMLKKKK